MAAVLSEAVVSIQRWELPDISRAAIVELTANAASAPTVQELEELEAQAREEGFVSGRAEGLAAAQQEIRQQQAQLSALFEAAAQPMQALDTQTEQALVDLALLVARRVLACELRLSPAVILRAVQQAIAAMPAASQALRVHVHPDDLAAVQASATAGSHWECVADPSLARGDCQLDSARSRLDARVETRLAAVVDAVLGDSFEAAEESVGVAP